MAEDLSKTQVDHLGDRLKKGSRTEADLVLLDKYRQSFGEAFKITFKLVRQILWEWHFFIEPTGRTAKSTHSIIEKLRRTSFKLSQIQDIAGCRVVVPDILAQEWFVKLLLYPRKRKEVTIADPEVFESFFTANSKPKSENDEELLEPIFPNAKKVDRRVNPSHGYRAVHIIVKVADKPVEIQIRSRLQDLWAELSEKLSDFLDPKIKYGGGDELVREYLMQVSGIISYIEEYEEDLFKVEKQLQNPRWFQDPIVWKNPKLWPENLDRELYRAWKDIWYKKERIAADLEEMGRMISELKKQIGPVKAQNILGPGLSKLLDTLSEWKKDLSEMEKRKEQ